MTPYEVLGVRDDATPDEIRAAYRVAAKRLHPDASGDVRTASAFRLATAAYDLLIDPDRRREYDRSRIRPAVRIVFHGNTSNTSTTTIFMG